jgi:predicted nucleic acid-binding protein
VSRFVLLDATPLGLAAHPRPEPRFGEWLRRQLGSDNLLVVPEIADYEVRRELVRAGLELAVRHLDNFIASVTYEPITTPVMRTAASLWAQARRAGRPTADPHALDGDVILAAIALSIAAEGHEVVVATDNARHLSLFVDARHWSDIEFGDTGQE